MAIVKNGRVQDTKAASQETCYKGSVQKVSGSANRVMKGEPKRQPSQLGGSNGKSYKPGTYKGEIGSDEMD